MVYAGSMSHLPPQAIAEFKALYRKHVGRDLPPDIAETRANEVFAVLRLAVKQPLPAETMASDDSISSHTGAAPAEVSSASPADTKGTTQAET